jgi:hypothetical protein
VERNGGAGDLALRVAGMGRAVYAAAVAALGVLLVSGTFVSVWAALPQWVPWRGLLTCAFGAVMAASALALLWRKTAGWSSGVVALVFAAWLVLVQAPRIAGAPSKELLWAGAAQIASLIAAAWLLFASRRPRTGGAMRWLAGAGGARAARSIYALALPLFGVHHFMAAAGATAAVPAWLPFPLAWVYFTGAAHVAAGAAILLGIAARLAATLEAAMIGAFVLLVHVPGVAAAPGDRLQWTMLVVASAIGGAAWIVARALAHEK